MLKISSSRDEVIEKVKAFLGAMAEGSGADEGAAPGVETPPPERARLGDRAIPADRLVRLSAEVAAVPPGERPLGPGKATRTRGPRWRWAPLKDRRGRGSRAACALTLPGAPRSAQVGAGQRVPLERSNLHVGCLERAPGTNGRARMLP